MWIIMILSYLTVSYIDTKGYSDMESKGKLFVYIALMGISCAISIANGYVVNMPSPAHPIRNLVMSIIGV